MPAQGLSVGLELVYNGAALDCGNGALENGHAEDTLYNVCYDVKLRRYGL